jgi:chromosome partitioning protein
MIVQIAMLAVFPF